MNKRHIELLSPARDLACGKAAINHGADAVYIGGPGFGARAAVSNSFSDIEQLVQYAHTFSSRVYVALNTVLYDKEIEEACQHVQRFYDAGVDALIVQDMGLLECDLPPIPFHASTQCNNRTAEKVRFLEDVGFEQVVLARELSLQQIAEIRQKTQVALEFFIHGALCVSYSGQCYISEAMTGRSGNRGQCAQFCRHKWSLEDGCGKAIANDYVLSIKDLNLSSPLEKLIDAGVDSLKIEGRLKGEQYVKNVTAHYRTLLDTIFEKRPELAATSSGTCTFSFTPDPEKSFNRSHTDYYLQKVRHKPGSTRTPKSIGEYVGKVVSSSKMSFVLAGDVQLGNGDGCCYLPEHGDLVGFRVNKVTGSTIFPAKPLKLVKGTRIYRNTDVSFNKVVEQSSQCRRIKINCFLSYNNGVLRLIIIDEDGISSECECALEYATAQQIGIAKRTAERQLVKTGDFPFTVTSVETDVPEDLFVAASLLNGLRRDGLTAHLFVRQGEYRKREFPRIASDVEWIKEELSPLDNVCNQKALSFYKRHGAVDSPNQEKILSALMHCKYCVRAQYGICGGKNQNAEPLFISDKTGRYKLSFDCQKCEMIVTEKGK